MVQNSNPNVVYGTLMRGYTKLNYLENVMHVERMLFKGAEANQTIFSIIMGAHVMNPDFKCCYPVCLHQCPIGFPHDQKARNILPSLAKKPEEHDKATNGDAEDEKRKILISFPLRCKES